MRGEYYTILERNSSTLFVIEFCPMSDEISDGSSSSEEAAGSPEAPEAPASSSDSEDNSAEIDGVAFNKRLATQHSYLGEDIEELRGCTVLPESEKMLLPILFNETVLFPLKSLPLSFGGNEIAFIEGHLKHSNAIVVAVPTIDASTNSYRVEIACTAEIHNKSYNSIHEELTVTTVGRQRVKVIHALAPKSAPVSFRLQMGLVQALPDDPIQPVPPLMYNCPYTLLRSALCAAEFVKAHGLDVSKQETRDILRPYTRFKRSGTTIAFHRWTLRLYEEDELMAHAKSLFVEKLGPLPCEMPTEFIAFTYKFAGSLPFVNNILLQILRIDSPHQRLHYIVKCLAHTSELRCIHCGSAITNSKFIFSMSQDGPLANYINPHGFVHDTLTVSKVLNALFIGKPTSEHSWFPGYKWTIMNCAHCRGHLGWKFQATKLLPKVFYGLTRRALKWEIP